MFFGHTTQVNRNLIEKVRLPDGTERVYLSPTKRRGVERRALLYAPVGKEFLTDLLECGIPNTCGKEDCPVCRIYGALVTEKTAHSDRTTFIGRLTHGGGVAIPPMDPLEKQRAMHPSALRREAGEEPTPFKRQYGAPGLLFPVYNHLLSATKKDFAGAAYAFLQSLARLGAGNPKGMDLYEDQEFGLYLVLDRYRVPLGRRVVLNPTLRDPAKALEEFQSKAKSAPEPSEQFHRLVGQQALEELQRLSQDFLSQMEERFSKKGSGGQPGRT